MPKVIFELPAGERREIDAEQGKSLLVAAHQNDIDIEGACEGAMAMDAVDGKNCALPHQ